MNPLNWAGFAAKKGAFLINENSTSILTGVGVVGTVATAYLTGRATFKAAKVLAEAGATESFLKPDSDNPEETIMVVNHRSKFNKGKLVWQLYIPPAATGIITITSIIMANKIASKKIAALAAASAISERALQEYKSKVIEKLGDRQDTKLRDEIAQDRVNNYPPQSQELIITEGNQVLCMDMLSGRYFRSTNEDLKRAENKINHALLHHMDASLSEFYEEIGLAPTSLSDTVGWNAANIVELKISTAMTPDGRPCLAVDFHPHPFATYSRFHDS